METQVKCDYQFVQEVMKLPVITSAASQLAHVYSLTKEYNPFVKYAMETAESIVKFGAENAKPILSKLDKSICTVDSLAYEQLKKLETNYPIVTQDPASIMETSKTALEGAKIYGYDKAQVVKNYGAELGREVINKVAEVVTLTEKYIDVLIPPVVCEEQLTTDEPKNSVQRLTVLSFKTHARLRCHAFQQLSKLKTRAENKLEELKAVLTCMKQKTTSVVTGYNERVQNLWLELKKDDVETEAQNWQEKLLQKARLLTKSLTHIFKQASSLLTYVSSSSKQKFLEASEKANNLYHNLKLGMGQLSRIRDISKSLQITKILSHCLEHFMNISALDL